MRMSTNDFELLQQYVAPKITKQETKGPPFFFFTIIWTGFHVFFFKIKYGCDFATCIHFFRFLKIISCLWSHKQGCFWSETSLVLFGVESIHSLIRVTCCCSSPSKAILVHIHWSRFLNWFWMCQRERWRGKRCITRISEQIAFVRPCQW